MAQAQTQVQQAVKNVSVMDPTSELSRFEERIRRQEAMARGMQEVAASSLEEQFAELEASEEELEVEARLASTTVSASTSGGGSKPASLPTAAAYRGAYSSSACSADASSRPLRHQPGHSTAPAKVRFEPTSR
jgi:hypothetical protein